MPMRINAYIVVKLDSYGYMRKTNIKIDYLIE